MSVPGCHTRFLSALLLVSSLITTSSGRLCGQGQSSMQPFPDDGTRVEDFLLDLVAPPEHACEHTGQ